MPNLSSFVSRSKPHDMRIEVVICIKLYSLNAQGHISKIIVNSSNLVLIFRIVASRDQFYWQEG